MEATAIITITIQTDKDNIKLCGEDCHRIKSTCGVFNCKLNYEYEWKDNKPTENVFYERCKECLMSFVVEDK